MNNQFKYHEPIKEKPLVSTRVIVAAFGFNSGSPFCWKYCMENYERMTGEESIFEQISKLTELELASLLQEELEEAKDKLDEIRNIL